MRLDQRKINIAMSLAKVKTPSQLIRKLLDDYTSASHTSVTIDTGRMKELLRVLLAISKEFTELTKPITPPKEVADDDLF